MKMIKKLAAPVAGIALVAAGLVSAAATDPIPNPLPNAVAGNVIKASDINDIATAVGILDERTLDTIFQKNEWIETLTEILNAGATSCSAGYTLTNDADSSGGPSEGDTCIKDQNILSATTSIERVGIRTTQPKAGLHLYGTGNYVHTSSINSITGDISPIIKSSIISMDPNHLDFGVSINTITESADLNAYGIVFKTQGSYSTGQTEKMRISGNGNVEIQNLSGSGTGFVCADNDGVIYKSAAACN